MGGERWESCVCASACARVHNNVRRREPSGRSSLKNEVILPTFRRIVFEFRSRAPIHTVCTASVQTRRTRMHGFAQYDLEFQTVSDRPKSC